MSLPIYPDKYGLPSLVTAEEMVEFRRKHSGLGALRAPEGVVLCQYNGLMRRFGWRHPSRYVNAFQCDLFLLKNTAQRVGVAGRFGMGAPALTALAEQLIAWGSRKLVILSLAGGLQPDLRAGSVVVCDRAVRDEGTSYHYLPPAEQVEAAGSLVRAICAALDKHKLPYSVGAAWSTDAVYRETQPEAVYFREHGIHTIDMESAGLFAAAQVRGAQAASVHVVGGRLSGSNWILPEDMPALHQRFRLLLEVLIQTLQEGG